MLKVNYENNNKPHLNSCKRGKEMSYNFFSGAAEGEETATNNYLDHDEDSAASGNWNQTIVQCQGLCLVDASHFVLSEASLQTKKLSNYLTQMLDGNRHPKPFELGAQAALSWAAISSGGAALPPSTQAEGSRFRMEAGAGAGAGFQVYCDGYVVISSGGGGGGGFEGGMDMNYSAQQRAPRDQTTVDESPGSWEENERKDDEGNESKQYRRTRSTTSYGGGGGGGIQFLKPVEDTSGHWIFPSISEVKNCAPGDLECDRGNVTRNANNTADSNGEERDVLPTGWLSVGGGGGCGTCEDDDPYHLCEQGADEGSKHVCGQGDDENASPDAEWKNVSPTLSLALHSCKKVLIIGGGGGGGGTAECTKPFTVGYGFNFSISFDTCDGEMNTSRTRRSRRSLKTDDKSYSHWGKKDTQTKIEHNEKDHSRSFDLSRVSISALSHTFLAKMDRVFHQRESQQRGYIKGVGPFRRDGDDAGPTSKVTRASIPLSFYRGISLINSRGRKWLYSSGSRSPEQLIHYFWGHSSRQAQVLASVHALDRHASPKQSASVATEALSRVLSLSGTHPILQPGNSTRTSHTAKRRIIQSSSFDNEHLDYFPVCTLQAPAGSSSLEAPIISSMTTGEKDEPALVGEGASSETQEYDDDDSVEFTADPFSVYALLVVVVVLLVMAMWLYDAYVADRSLSPAPPSPSSWQMRSTLERTSPAVPGDNGWTDGLGRPASQFYGSTW
jgi:hypothetical protein